MSRSIIGEAFRALWLRLGGGRVLNGRAVAWWRKGQRNSVAVDWERGLWFDHATGKGGDAIALIAEVRGCSIADALAWAEAEAYRKRGPRPTAAEIAIERRRREQEQERRQAVADFRPTLNAELDRLKQNAVDEESLAKAAELQYRLARFPEAVLAEMLQQDADHVKWLIEQGREDRDWTSRLVASVVYLLATAKSKEAANARRK